jgi:glycosyltransferase involved in cell wall biosynthesis
MTAAPRLALIVNTWNQPEVLARVLDAVSRQADKPEEIVLAEDDTDPATQEIFQRWTARQSARTQHVRQKHEGFRRSCILNQAIACAAGEYLIFLDGDTLPHPQFIADHRRLARRGAFLQGHRALVQEAAATWFGRNAFRSDRRRAFWRGQLAGWKHAFRWPRPLVRARRDLQGIRGCNLGIWRDDLVRVNGYNEGFVGWGREDSELAVRLMNSGRQRLDVRGWALCYHIWHPPADRAGLAANDELLAQAQKTGATRCECGLDQHLS